VGYKRRVESSDGVELLLDVGLDDGSPAGRRSTSRPAVAGGRVIRCGCVYRLLEIADVYPPIEIGGWG
jgi:hypothetical protein